MGTKAASFTSTQLSSVNFPTPALQGLTGTQLDALATSAPSAFQAINVANLTTTQVQGMGSTGVGALSASQVSGLANTQIASLTTSEMASLSSTELQSWTTGRLGRSLQRNSQGSQRR